VEKMATVTAARETMDIFVEVSPDTSVVNAIR
jgi:hypothetical protein